jgi:UDP-N-acetylglucosamine:LPS N-acetylglucosamine transferase
MPDRELGGPVSSPSAVGRRVLLVSSSGGHLAQLLTLKPWWETLERSFVTFSTPDAVSQLGDEQVDFAFHPTTRNIPNLIRNFGVAAKVLRKRRPDLIVSTGAAVAVPFFVFGRILGIPTAYIEVFDRLDSRTLTGRLCRPLSSLFCVQWERQRRLYPGSTLIGRLL